MSTVAIHQPNYFPWIGYFAKMFRCDTFIFLDSVQYSKGSYQNRVKIKTPKGDQWLSQPVTTKGKLGCATTEVSFADEEWPMRHFATLHSNYQRSKYWDEYQEDLKEVLLRGERYLAEKNIELIQWAASKLRIPVRCVRASSLVINEQDATLRLIKLVRAVGGNIYLHGAGAVGYQNAELFSTHGVELQALSFVHPVYDQLWDATFLPGLSILDLLLNEGPNARRMIENAIQNKKS